MKCLQPRYLIAFLFFSTVVHGQAPESIGPNPPPEEKEAEGIATNKNPFGPSHAPITGSAGIENGALDLSPQPSFKPEGPSILIGEPLNATSSTGDDSTENSAIGSSDQQSSEASDIGSKSSSSNSSHDPTARDVTSNAVVTGKWSSSALAMVISVVIVMLSIC